MDFEIVSAFVVISMTLSIFPGPDNIFVLTQSLVNGTRAGLTTVLGLVSGCLVHTTLLAIGISEVIKSSYTLFFVIKLFGACYLLFLAVKIYRSKGTILLDQKDVSNNKVSGLFWKGFTMNVLNPKVALFFLAFFPGFLFSDSMNTIVQFYVLGVLFMLVAFIIFGLIAILAGAISSFLLKHPGTGPFLKWVQIFVFLGIALYLLLSDK